MSLANVLESITTKVESLGFELWDDAFPVDNIPSTISDRAFQIEIGSITSGAANQRTHIFRMPLNVRVIRRGFRYPNEARSSALVDADTILAGLLAASFRLGPIVDDVKDLIPTSVDLGGRRGTNNKNIILSLSFEALIVSLF